MSPRGLGPRRGAAGAAAVAVLALAAAAPAAAARAQEAREQCRAVWGNEPLAASVNGLRIPLGTLERYARAHHRGKPAETLNRLIDEAVIESEARRQELVVGAAELDQAVAGRKLALSSAALLETDVRGEECFRLLRERLYVKVTGGAAQVLPAEARAYYDAHPDEFAPPPKVQVRRLRLTRKATGKTDDALAAEAERIRLAVASGRSRLDDEARPYWAPGAPAEGTWIVRGSMSKEYAPGWDDEIFPLEAGRLSRSIRTSEGWELVEVQRHMPSPGPPPFDQIRGRVAYAIEQRRSSTWEKSRKALHAAADIRRQVGEDGRLRGPPPADERFPSTSSIRFFAAQGNLGMTCSWSAPPQFVVEPVAPLLREPHYGALVDGVVPFGTPVFVCEQRLGWAYASLTHQGRASAGFLPAAALSRDDPAPRTVLAAIEAARGDRERAGVWAERYLGAIRHRSALVPDERGAVDDEAVVRDALAAAGRKEVVGQFERWLRGRDAFDVGICEDDPRGLFWVARFAPARGLQEAPRAAKIAHDDVDRDRDRDAEAGFLTATNWYQARAAGPLAPATPGGPPFIKRWPAGYDPPADMNPPPATAYRAVADCADAGRLMVTAPAFTVGDPGARASDALRRACARSGGARAAEWTAIGTERAVRLALATCAKGDRFIVAIDDRGRVSTVRVAPPRR